MAEPGEITDVIDAFDDGDLFDLNISLGFQYFTKSAKIRRESAIASPGLTDGYYTSNQMNVASYSETTAKLTPRIDIGIYKDLAFHVSLPIILNNSRELTDLDGSANNAAYILRGASGEQLFSLPFTSPDRSGLEYLGLGLDLDIMNQARDRTKPTWLLGFEARLPVSQPMSACTESPLEGQVKCAAPSDVNRNGADDGDDNGEGRDAAARDPGVGRGTVGLELHTILSKRMKYVEPYGGFRALFEFFATSDDYDLTSLEGSLVNMPPIVGTVMLGMMIIPWENREKFGRLSFDMRVEGEYHSEGRDYSELFDALGSSTAPSLRNPQWAGYTGDIQGNSVIDTGSSRSYFTGLSNVQPYGSIRASASATWQASELVKFQFGMGFRHDGAHGLGGDQPCNPSVKDDVGRSGPCRRDNGDGSFTQTGIPNPNYRHSINAVGRRFYADAITTIDLFASGVVMF
ncbi:hypothetical protein [Chondromyces apiculatus]|uniref:Uncharacterized protein n=1 Tax=Chondromyces apiculatus DSM 436 TaxID=1192034 RepID=A0A017SYF2_9BACT|nr:hypothetical protein [Chondromyces apiculatus]EYF02004.1 Hypothetical protein CAP_7622 [Chondromyces apiculatus DSM 436]